MRQRASIAPRPLEAQLLLLLSALIFLGFLLAEGAFYFRQELSPIAALPEAVFPPVAFLLPLLLLHYGLRLRGISQEPLLLPLVGLLAAAGMIMIWRLLGADGIWKQLMRGWLPGFGLIAMLLFFPNLIELLRRRGVPAVSGVGLLLLLATAFIGQPSPSGARLALRIGSLPPIQTSEIIKLALIIFLAWYIERVGEEAEGRARAVGWLRLPDVKYFIPGILFVALATVALVRMADFGAILIIGALFIGMLYSGFETRIFATIAAIGVALSLVMGFLLALFWQPPDVIRHRFIAFLDPWSEAPLLFNGVPAEITVAQGPGYQIQQALYAIGAGGLSGTGPGFGTPHFVPLAHSDFIFAAVVEELGGLVALALLLFFSVLLLRILRLAILLPAGQQFERLLLVGIAIHFFTQVFVMVGGTLNLLPLTGITVPFLSQGGIALIVNLVEVGLVLALLRRLEPRL